jgi:L-amino acid N-acyltransferase YncA
MEIRDAGKDDMEGITAIYNDAVEHTTAIWPLMLALIERARDIGKHVMVAGIEAKNGGSIRLHEKLGFEAVGHLKEVGMKFGSWLDLAFPQLTLDARAAPDQSS